MIRRINSSGSGAPMRTGDKLFVSVVFTVFFIAGCFFCYLLGKQAAAAVQMYAWPTVDCEIVSSRGLDDPQPRRNSNPYQFIVQYRYTVDGKNYESSTYSHTSGHFSDYESVQRLLLAYPAGQKAKCYVNPANANEAVLKRDSLFILFGIPFSLIFVTIGGGGLYLVWRQPKPTDTINVSGGTGTTKQASPGCALIILTPFFLMVTAMFIGMALLPVWRIQKAKNWPAVSCRVISSRLQSHSGKHGSTYSVDILYEYQVNGATYRSSRYQFMSGSSSGSSSKQGVVNHYAPRSTATCYVDPNDPASAVLNRSFTPDLWFGLIPLVFMLIIGALMVKIAKQRAQQVNAAPPKRHSVSEE